MARALAEPHLKSGIISGDEREGMMDCHAVAVSPGAPDQPLLANRMGLFQTDDHGSHWRELGVRSVSPIFYGRDVRPSPHDRDVLFATLSTSANGATGNAWRSDDVGKSWTRIDPGVAPGSTLMAVAPSLRERGVIYTAARKGEVFGTRDGGASWQAVPLPAGCLGVMSLAVS
jgi:photosystem II stability/assembly factor-like uncharacterized protein